MRLPSLARPGMAYFPRRWHDRQMPSSTTAVTEHQVREARLAAQHLRGPGLPHLPAVVEHLVAVQSQEFWLSLWGLASRIGPTPDIADSRTAFDGGDVVRTHLLRPTWHTVTPRDARWLLALTGPRVHQVNSSQYRSIGLTPELLDRSRDVLTAAVARQEQPRSALAATLEAHGLPHTGLPLTGFLMNAELTCGIVSGATRGKHHTYAAFDARVPAGFGPLGNSFDRDAAVVELVRRYLASRALATAHDFSRWSGLTVTDTKRALDDLGAEVAARPGAETLEGLTFWGPADLELRAGARQGRRRTPAPRVDLLQPYDEYEASYPVTRTASHEPGPGATTEPPYFLGAIAVDGRVAGRWRSTTTTRELRLETQWYRQPTAPELDAVESEGARLARFWGLGLAAVLREPAVVLRPAAGGSATGT